MSEDKEWIEDLKVGDKVFMRTECSNAGMGMYFVKKITPTRQIRVNGILFKNGYNYTGIYGHTLVKWSQGKEDKLRSFRERQLRINKLINIDWHNVNMEIMDATYDALYEAGVFDE